MKPFCFFTVLFLMAGIYSVSGQDFIIQKNGEIIEAKVMEISNSEIRFKRFNHLDGPMIVIPKADVLSIRYENGTTEIISSPPVARQESPQERSQERPQEKPQERSQERSQEISPGNQQPVEIPSVPLLGQPTVLQQAFNLLPAVPIGRNKLKFEFGGDYWIAKNNGRNLLAGTFITQETDEGIVLILRQTHMYPPRDLPGINWIRTPGPEIVLEYKEGPPASIRLGSRSEATASGQTKKEKV